MITSENIKDSIKKLKEIEELYFTTDKRTFELNFETVKALKTLIEYAQQEEQKKDIKKPKDKKHIESATESTIGICKKELGNIAQEAHEQTYLIGRCAQALYLINGTLDHEFENRNQRKKIIARGIFRAAMMVGLTSLFIFILWRFY